MQRAAKEKSRGVISELASYLVERAGELVGARCWFGSATDAADAVGGFGAFHSSHESGHALSVAGASAHEGDVVDSSVCIDVDIDSPGACAGSFEFVLHMDLSGEGDYKYVLSNERK